MFVYAIVCTTDCQGSSRTQGIYADEMSANAVCAALNAKAKSYEDYEVFIYELDMK